MRRTPWTRHRRNGNWTAALLLIAGCGVAVITTVVISRAIVKAERHAEDARSFADNIVETVRKPLLVLDGELRVVRVNRAFCQTFKVTPAETANSLLYKVGNGQWDILELRTLLEESPQHTGDLGCTSSTSARTRGAPPCPRSPPRVPTLDTATRHVTPSRRSTRLRVQSATALRELA
ncbi:MAG: hypothetical protein IPG92_00585 [Flavobacteriales bacterium]|nr:hypothetical protein [Flavobacteriales bacterium]